MKKLLSLRHWSQTFSLIWKLLTSSNVSLLDKCLFAIPVLIYWFSPDVMPFIPIDDIAFTMIVAKWFAHRMGKKYNIYN